MSKLLNPLPRHFSNDGHLSETSQFAIAMRPDRTVAANLENIWQTRDTLRQLGYAQGIDGVWVPTCDLRQYNAGKRPMRLQVGQILPDWVVAPREVDSSI